jgi:serine/threonine-protein kinase
MSTPRWVVLLTLATSLRAAPTAAQPSRADSARHYVLEALGGVADAHVHGIVHRDLKPPNLFLAHLADGRRIVKILDFGISKALDADALQLTATRAFLGSPLYMSPEQVHSPKAVDARTDIWAMGVVMYKLLTGTVPFNGDTPGEVFAGILERVAPSVLLARPDVHPGLARVVAGCRCDAWHSGCDGRHSRCDAWHSRMRWRAFRMRGRAFRMRRGARQMCRDAARRPPKTTACRG